MQPNPLETANLVTFADEILNGKLHFSCSEVIIIFKTDSKRITSKLSQEI